MLSRLSALSAVLFVLATTGCNPVQGTCTPDTCNGCCDATGSCQAGNLPDACGAPGGACSACPSGNTCQFAACVPSTCTPTSCAAAGKNCGMLADGCGTDLSCGTCSVAGESCGGSAGIPNLCGPGTCTPKTCADLGKNCGDVSDGCGAVLKCGGCTAPESCGGGGTANVCGQGACAPKTCAQQQKNCGVATDGCTGQVQCGSCTKAGDTCGGGGTANVCGQGACVPKTCAQLTKNCGVVMDGCGNALDCGMCAGFDSCGGAGVANVCGATCSVTCPNGFSCSGGVCTGGNLQGLNLDVPVPPQHVTSGAITRNGLAPVLTSCLYVTFQGTNQYIAGTIEFLHATDTRFNATAIIPCSSASATGWTYNASLYPGTYKVTVKKSGQSNLPSWGAVTHAALVVSAPATVNLEVPVPPQHVTSGSLTRNGVAPVLTSCLYVSFQGTNQYIAGTIDFDHATDSRFDTTTIIPCSSSSATGWTYSVPLYPGAYKVTVKKSGQSNLPSWDTVTHAALMVSAPASNVNLEVPVPPQHVTAGAITRNGLAPVLTSCLYVTFQGTNQYIAGTIDFVHATEPRFNTTTIIPCSSASATGWTYSAPLYPGTYKVTVKKSGQSNLPSWDTVALAALTVSAPASNVNLEIPVPIQHLTSGTVTRNGLAPVLTSCLYVSFQGTNQYIAGTVEFDHATDAKFDSTTVIPCSSSSATAWTFSAPLYPGTYKVTVKKSGQSNLPSWATVTHAALVVSAPASNVILEVPVPPQHVTSGSITRNGIAPVLTSCLYVTFQGTNQYIAGTIEFVHATETRFNATAIIPCSSASATGWTYAASLYPGTYKVTVKKSGQSNLPAWDTVAKTALTVAAPASNVTLDVPVPAQTTVSGKITMNGNSPSLTSCLYVTFQGTNQYIAGTLEFEHLTDTRFSTNSVIPCTSASATTWTYSVQLYPGVYRVSVKKSGQSNLPTWETIAVDRVQVP